MKSADFLVIGSGIAGLTYALDVAEQASVIVLCKKSPFDTNTRYAQGGIASVWDKDDSFDAHIRDTLTAGAGLCDENTVERVITEAPKEVSRLIKRGVKFDLNKDGVSYSLGMEGGHSARRILHSKDTTGAEIQRALYSEASSHPNIKILDSHTAIDLVVDKANNCISGLYAYDSRKGKVETFASPCVLLATGGIGKVYLYTSNSDVATGDGIAMAHRAGCPIANMEFIQFHPTCLYHPKAKSFLISEALRGEGAKLLNRDGVRFMTNYHKLKELAPRDVVARAIDTEMKKTGEEHVFLDISFESPDFITSRFPKIHEITKEFSYNITKEPIPVVPAEHYCCGGIITDENGMTSVDGLYVAGESAYTGLHGANRLASNGLLEALVFAKAASAHCLSLIGKRKLSSTPSLWDNLDTEQSSENVIVSYIWDEVRRLMWNLVGIVRSDKRLLLAERRIMHIKEEVADYYWKYLITEDLLELRNIIDVATIIIQSAKKRRESRGLHFNLDCNATDNKNWKKRTVVKNN